MTNELEKPQCDLLSNTGIFIQFLLGSLCILSLLVKKTMEKPSRRMGIFLLDTFKQLSAQSSIHVINVYLSKYLTKLKTHESKTDECSWYFLTFLIDLFPGLVITILLAKLYDFTFEKCRFFNLISGNYIKDIDGIAVVNYTAYISQVFLWLSIVLITKIVVFLIQVPMLSFLSLVASVVLGFLAFSIDFKLFFVLILFPLTANIIIFWTSDGLLKKKKWRPEEELLQESFYERRGSIITKDNYLLQTHITKIKSLI